MIDKYKKWCTNINKYPPLLLLHDEHLILCSVEVQLQPPHHVVDLEVVKTHDCNLDFPENNSDFRLRSLMMRIVIQWWWQLWYNGLAEWPHLRIGQRLRMMKRMILVLMMMMIWVIVGLSNLIFILVRDSIFKLLVTSLSTIFHLKRKDNNQWSPGNANVVDEDGDNDDDTVEMIIITINLQVLAEPGLLVVTNQNHH